MLIREVPIFVLSHKNSRVLERGEGGGGGGGRREGVGGRRGEGGEGLVGKGGADGERETGDALSMHGSRKK